MATQNTHLGRNVKRLREILGMKQETLAVELGSDWNQKKISMLEAKDMIDRPLLEKIAGVLNVPVDAIENFSEEGAVNIVSNTFQDFKDNAIASANNCTFNPLDKLMEVIEENKALYERLIQEKDAMINELKEMMRKK